VGDFVGTVWGHVANFLDQALVGIHNADTGEGKLLDLLTGNTTAVTEGPVFDLQVFDGDLYLGTDTGVYKTPTCPLFRYSSTQR